MSFLEGVMEVLGSLAGSQQQVPAGYYPQLPAGPTIIPTTTTAQDYWGSGPGLDWGDIPDFLGAVFENAPFAQIGAGGVIQPKQALPDIGPTPNGVPYGGTKEAWQEGNKIPLRGLYIGGNTPGLWHTTQPGVRYHPKTGAAIATGGNRVANRVSIVQDDSGAMMYVAPVKPTGWKFLYKQTRSRKHTHKVRHRHPKARSAPKQIAAHSHSHKHRKSLTPKQQAYFGTTAQQKRYAHLRK